MQLLLLLLLLLIKVRQRGGEKGAQRMWPIGAWHGASVAFWLSLGTANITNNFHFLLYFNDIFPGQRIAVAHAAVAVVALHATPAATTTTTATKTPSDTQRAQGAGWRVSGAGCSSAVCGSVQEVRLINVSGPWSQCVFWASQYAHESCSTHTQRQTTNKARTRRQRRQGKASKVWGGEGRGRRDNTRAWPK